MRKFLIGIGLFLVSSVSAYSASWSLAIPLSHVDKIQAEMTRQLVIHPEFQDIRWRVGIKRLRDNPAGGQYTIWSDGSATVLIGHKIRTFAIRKLMAHEFGHHVWFTRMDDSQRDNYCRLFGYFDRSASDKGRENCEENFADGYAVIHYDARWSHAPTYGYYGTYQSARTFFLLTQQGEFINNLR